MRFSKHPSDVSCQCYTLYVVYICYLQGIRYLIEQNLLNHTAEDIAVFLYEGSELLNKVAIGEYLGAG